MYPPIQCLWNTFTHLKLSENLSLHPVLNN